MYNITDVNVIRDILGKNKENMEEITPILVGLQKLRVPAVGGDHAILAGLQKLRVPAMVLNLCCYHSPLN